MIYHNDGTFLPDSIIDCYNENSLDPFKKHGNCENCAIQKFTKRSVIYLPRRDIHDTIRKNRQLEIVEIESCPWFKIISEKNRALLENDELKKKLIRINMLTSIQTDK